MAAINHQGGEAVIDSPALATIPICIYCGRPLHQPVGLDDWKADTGLVTCFDSPDRTHRRTEWCQDIGSPTTCLVDDEGGVCGRDECPRCGAGIGSSQGPGDS